MNVVERLDQDVVPGTAGGKEHLPSFACSTLLIAVDRFSLPRLKFNVNGLQGWSGGFNCWRCCR